MKLEFIKFKNGDQIYYRYLGLIVFGVIYNFDSMKAGFVFPYVNTHELVKSDDNGIKFLPLFKRIIILEKDNIEQQLKGKILNYLENELNAFFKESEKKRILAKQVFENIYYYEKHI